jgi:hypothetical protein
MPRHLPLLSCLVLSACASTPPAIPIAPLEEASNVEFPLSLPRQGLRHLPGNMAAAIQLALDDFLPRDASPTPGLPFLEPCLYQRESYDVTAAPAPDAVMLVRFVVNLEVCDPGESIVDVTTYAVDVKTMRILAIGYRTPPRSRFTPSPPDEAAPGSPPAPGT